MLKLPELVEGDRVQVVMDRFLMASAFVEGLREALAGKELCFFSDIVPNPTTDNRDSIAWQNASIPVFAVTFFGMV